MRLHTYEEWNSKGARVKKGERAASKDARGALFSDEQVWFPDAEGTDFEEDLRQEQSDYEAARL